MGLALSAKWCLRFAAEFHATGLHDTAAPFSCVALVCHIARSRDKNFEQLRQVRELFASIPPIKALVEDLEIKGVLCLGGVAGFKVEDIIVQIVGVMCIERRGDSIVVSFGGGVSLQDEHGPLRVFICYLLQGG